MRHTKWISQGTMWALAVVAVLLTPVVKAQGVAMVLSTSGAAEVVDSKGATRLARPMLVLQKGDAVATGKGGSVLVVLFADSLEYTIGANGRVRFTADNLEKESGSLKVSRDHAQLKLPSNNNLSSRKLMGQMIRDHRVAGSNFLNPPNFAQVRAGSMLFSWQLAEPAKKVSFTLYGPNDEELLSTEVTGNSLSFPPDGYKALQPGSHYFSEVYDTAASSGSVTGRAQSEFRVMTGDEVAEVEAGENRVAELAEQNPDDPAPLMKLMLLYMHHRLYTDAVTTGERLKAMLPDNPELLHMQARALAASGLIDKAREVEQVANKLDSIK